MCSTGWPNARNILNATCGCLWSPGPWHATRYWKEEGIASSLAVIFGMPNQANEKALKRSKTIGHFRITFGLFFKASPGAHPFIWKLVFIHMQMRTNFHMKRWAPGLALKTRPKVIRKWPIVTNLLREFIWWSRNKLYQEIFSCSFSRM